MKRDEMWKPIDGYHGKYEISSHGRIKSLERFDSIGRRIREKIMKTQPNKDGYLNITLKGDDGKRTYLLHRLVALHFVDNPFGYDEINHKDTDPSNPEASNLEWCTRQYNANYADAREKNRIANFKKVNKYDSLGNFIESYISVKAAAVDNNIPDTNISACCKGKRRTAAGHQWEYAETGGAK